MTMTPPGKAHDQWSRAYLSAGPRRDRGAANIPLNEVHIGSLWDCLNSLGATARAVIEAYVPGEQAAEVLAQQIVRHELDDTSKEA